jgi:hypothetical protein
MSTNESARKQRELTIGKNRSAASLRLDRREARLAYISEPDEQIGSLHSSSPPQPVTRRNSASHAERDELA